MKKRVAGVDGCRGGWVVVLAGREGPAMEAFLVARFAEVLSHQPAADVIAVDCPIGLPEIAIKGGRLCCNLARARLGARRSSVFSVPAQAALAARDYAEACALNLKHSNPPRRLAKQTFHIMDRIREIDAMMTPGLQARVFECHPELAFAAMKGSPLDWPKKRKGRPCADGLALRRRLLDAAGLTPPALPPRRDGMVCGEDDLLDACACLVTARRIAAGRALRLPEVPPVNAKGLRMEILA